MTDFMQLPLQAKGIVLLIFVGLVFFLLTRIVNWVFYVWAVCSMPRDERIKYLIRKKPGIEIPSEKVRKKCCIEEKTISENRTEVAFNVCLKLRKKIKAVRYLGPERLSKHI